MGRIIMAQDLTATCRSESDLLVVSTMYTWNRTDPSDMYGNVRQIGLTLSTNHYSNPLMYSIEGSSYVFNIH
jgi:hypothetical protein